MSRGVIRRRAFDVAAGALGASLLFLAITLLSAWLRPEPSATSTEIAPLTATPDARAMRLREQEVLAQLVRPPVKDPAPERRPPQRTEPPSPTIPSARPSPAPAPAATTRPAPVPQETPRPDAPASPTPPSPAETIPEAVAGEPGPAATPPPAAEPSEATPPQPAPTIDPRSQEVRQAALLNDYIERLQNAATYKARLDAADNLASLGDQRAVPYLQYSAQSDDSAFVRSRCRKILKDTFGVEAN